MTETYEIAALLNGLCERRLTDDELRRLESLVRHDAAAMQAYLEYMHLHGELHRAGGFPAAPIAGGQRPAPSLLSPLRQPGRSRIAIEPPAPAVSAQASQMRGPLSQFWLDRRLALHTLAALLFMFVLGSGALWLMAPRPLPVAEVASPIPSVSPTAAVARLSGQFDADWVETPGDDDLPASKVLQLNSGVAELTFTSGAVGVLQGPAQVELASPRRIVLREGKLVMRVPPPAVGFTVALPDAEVVDLGTEFGVQVDGRGAAIVHVFEGEVELHRTSQAPDAADTLGARLLAGEAAAILNGVVRPVRVDAAAFVRKTTLEQWQAARRASDGRASDEGDRP